MSDAAQNIVDRALFMLNPVLRENVRLQIDAAIAAERSDHRCKSIAVQEKYYDIPQRNKDGEPAAQIISGFLDLGPAPWDARELLGWLERSGYEVVLKN